MINKKKKLYPNTYKVLGLFFYLPSFISEYIPIVPPTTIIPIKHNICLPSASVGNIL